MALGPSPHQETRTQIRLIKTVGKHSWDKYGSLSCIANFSSGVASTSDHTRGRMILQVFILNDMQLTRKMCLATTKESLTPGEEAFE